MATPYDTAIPGADSYANADVLATNAYNKALTQINANRLNTLTSYGYTGTVNPTTGVVGGVHIDPNSIYGQAQQLFHNQANEDRNAEYAVEDRGLFGGLAHQGASELRYQHGAQRTQLGGALQSSMDNLDAQQQQAAEARDNALGQAEQAALQNEMQNEYSQTIQGLLDQLLNPSSPKGNGDTNTTPPVTPPTMGPLYKPGTHTPNGSYWVTDPLKGLALAAKLHRAVAN